jgi:integrase
MGKTRRRLDGPLNDTALEILRGKQAVRHGPCVFYNPATGDRFVDLKAGLKAALRRSGLKGITWRTFRHTFASRLTRSGVDLVTVKELPGHATISTTMRYAHSNHEAKARVVALLRSGHKIVTIVPGKQKNTKMSS